MMLRRENAVACAFSNPAEQKKSHWTGPHRRSYPPDATERQSAPTELTVAGGPRVRILLAPAESRANFQSPRLLDPGASVRMSVSASSKEAGCILLVLPASDKIAGGVSTN
jgi:hypothetical protein